VKKILPIVLLLIPLISLGFNALFLTQNNRDMTVTSVHDGDTFTLGDGQRVRLIGINAPEIGRCGSDEAKKLLESLVLNKKIKITEEKRDTYGRRMGLVYIGSKLVNEEMLKTGWAKANYDPNSESERLKTANKYANDNKLGVHSGLCKKINPTPPSKNCNIKGNIDKATGERFYHLPNCPHYNQIILDLDIGEDFFCSEKEAREAGFKLASECGK
jgi:endonuclease YncB( thermonuclease family)